MKPATNLELARQIERHGIVGNLQDRIEYAYSTNDNLVDPSLLLEKKTFFSGAGINIEDYIENAWGFGTPTKGQSILPHKGDLNVLVLVFGFNADVYGPDGYHTDEQTVEAVERAFNGFGNPEEYPYESVRNYYLRSSYGKCRFNADVYGWIGIPDPAYEWYESGGEWYWRDNFQGPGGVFSWFLENSPLADEIDWAKYDNDHDGYVEGLFLIWNWYDLGWGSPWWPACYHAGSYFGSYSVDNVQIDNCVWSWYSQLKSGMYTYDPHTDIHETGHLLGLPDLYDYDGNSGPDGGVGGLDMMDWNWGDHNAWSKFLLNWIRKPKLIFPFRNATPQTIELRPSSSYEDAVIIMPNTTMIDPYNDLFVVEYRKKGDKNNPSTVCETDDTWPFPTSGMLIWHVDSTLEIEDWDFAYDNSYTRHKYVKLMEADGLNEIETVADYLVNENDFWKEGQIFDDNSTPNAWLYNIGGGEGRCPSGVIVDQIGPAGGDTMTARFQIVK